MTELLKDCYSKKFITSLSKEIEKVYPPFKSQKFTQGVFDNEWNSRELKARMRHITIMLHQFLPDDFSKAISILKKITRHAHGFEYMFLPDYVEVYGLESYDKSIQALEFFTEYASAEFAVRPFILKYPKKMMQQMGLWAKSNNEHVRRLASEGCRPRLPWANALPEFKENPKPIINIIKKLKNDSSVYVRKSVANNLNDISKDNPQLVIEITKDWIGKNEEIDKLVKHACRTLLKQSNLEVLGLFGLDQKKDINVVDFSLDKSVKMGKELSFSFTLKTKEACLGKTRIEYEMEFLKKNGSYTRKRFKVSEGDNKANTKAVKKLYSFRKISTRKYYTGKHGLRIFINGIEKIKSNFELIK